jgi:hypothetical protein
MVVKMIPLDEIELDLSNPRIARMLSMHKNENITSELIALALGAGDSQEGDTYATYRNLKESIRTNGGVIHPIIVNKNSNGKITVIEGNTRLQIYKEFRQEKAKGVWDKIPAIVHESLPQKNIDAIRLQAHLVGPRPWDPYSKARYLHLLNTEDSLTTNQIVEFCGGKRKQVLEYIQAYLDMESSYRPQLKSEEDFDTTRFSAFMELQKPRVQNALASNGYTKKDFSKWVIDDLFHPLETVRSLPDILTDQEAKTVFLEQGASEARIVLNAKIASSDSEFLNTANLLELSNEISRKLSKMAHTEWMRMKANVADPTRASLSNLMWELKDYLKGIVEEDDA